MEYNNDIDKQLDDYSDLFDIYIERGKIPEKYTDDPISHYMGEQLVAYNDYLGDEDMRELLRENLLDFFQQILPHFLMIQNRFQQELNMIETFFGSNLVEKRQQWEDVKLWLSSNYSRDDFNVAGYSKMFGDNEKTNEQIFDAMEQNWKFSSEQKRQRDLNKQLYGWQGNNQSKIISISKTDYQTREKMRQTSFRYPALSEILKMIGREHEASYNEKDVAITRNIPILLRHAKIKQEIDGVTIGDNLLGLLPIEYALMDEAVFYKKFANKELQQFSNKPPTLSKQKTEIVQIPIPRLEKGPIILAIDTSGSMHGRPMEISKALLSQIVLVARRQKRKCFIITFSVRAQYIEISRPNQYRKVEEFFANHFTGGTDGEEMFREAINALNQDHYSMADVLVISDFEFSIPNESTIKKIKKEQKKGTRFYGLCIKGSVGEYCNYLDRHWII